MPSSYSARLRLEKQASGENDSTWGTILNTALEMIDDAIAGRAAVSMGSDANYTLTSNNNASDEARMAILNIASGVALTATRDVIVPTLSKKYVVKNATTGGQSIRVKTSGGTGVTIPNGFTALVICDGTHVVDMVDWVSSLTVSAAFALSGILSPAQITSDQNDYSPTGLSTASVLRLSTDALRNLTGLAGGAAGRVIKVHNIGSNDLVLKDESSSSTAANRFALAQDCMIGPDESVTLVYDATTQRWRLQGEPANTVATDMYLKSCGLTMGGI